MVSHVTAALVLPKGKAAVNPIFFFKGCKSSPRNFAGRQMNQDSKPGQAPTKTRPREKQLEASQAKYQGFGKLPVICPMCVCVFFVFCFLVGYHVGVG